MVGFIDKFSEYIPVTSEIEADVIAKVNTIERKQGDFLYKAGQIPNSLYLLNEGALRVFYQAGSKDIISWFIFENTLFGSSLSLFSNRPSFQNVQFLENSKVEYITYKDLRYLYEKHPTMNSIGRRIAEQYCIILEEKICSLQNQKADEKYKDLLKEYPDILQRVSLKYIASYLGITQETLSRIRKFQ